MTTPSVDRKPFLPAPAGPTPLDARREEQVLRFFARWGHSWAALNESFQLLDDDAVWDRRPMPRVRGPVGARRFLSLARRLIGLDTIDVEVTALAVNRDVVLVERVDRLRRRDGSLIAAAPVTGVLTFAGESVIHWREYYDSASFTAQAVVSGATWLSRRAAVALGR
ncbi:MAG TPA: limonene-1,2-epoxide hydrolase family protein [Pseudonocardia sp.]|nr:limonene-1,2-epoxide hydrolase family protein [Pseudonocardia sp.]